MENKRSLALSIVDRLGLSGSIKNIVIEETDSPWQEKALIKRKRGLLDIKALVWDDESFLYGRIYRLFLYIADVLRLDFQYDPRITPDEEKEPLVRDRYNQIWSLHVDSRMERLSIENFFNRELRKNIFVDLEGGLGWKRAERIFSILWSKETYTYPVIVDFAYNLEERFPEIEGAEKSAHAPENEIIPCLYEPSVKKHMERLSSPKAVALLDDLLSFAAYSCKDTIIAPCHYGILFFFQRKIFMEIIPSSDNVLAVTIFDALSNRYETFEIGENADISKIQGAVKEFYSRMALQTKENLG